jgi:[acyl-carrier-protein] S-malonyltransferase
MPSYHRIAFLFPGQGSQYPGMGKDIVDHFPLARQTIEEADDILNRKLSSIIFEGPEALLTETQNSQTAIFVISIALVRVLKELFPSLQPQVCAGLSLGEYTALTAGEFLSFRDCLVLVQHRAQFMNEACERHKGTMAVVMGLEADVVERLVYEVALPNDLWAANFNCPGQVVISGTEKGIALGSEAAKAKGAKRVLPLSVHGAFHSGLMREAGERLAPYIDNAPIRQGKAELVMNVPGDFVKDVGQIKQNLIKQVTHPVRWEQGVRAMHGADLFIEVGCGKTLAGMHKRIGVASPILSFEKMDDLDIIAKSLA